MRDLIEKGSQTAKDGFKNEEFVIIAFNNWKTDILAQEWLKAMNYQFDEIEDVKAHKITGSFKADIQVQINIEIKLKKLQDIQNLQVKLVSNPNGFNQIDKRWVENYTILWNIPEDIQKIFKYFTGALPPYRHDIRDKRRMFMDELTCTEQEAVIKFIKKKSIYDCF